MIEIFVCLLLVSPAFADDNTWSGEWGSWKTADQGAGLQIKKDAFRFSSRDAEGHFCKFEGRVASTSDADAKATPKGLKQCALLLAQDPAAGNRSLKITFEGSDCVRGCNSEKAMNAVAELPQLHAEVFEEPLPWPHCQSVNSSSLQLLCKDADLSRRYNEAKQANAKARDLQATFYVAEASRVAEEKDPLKTCDASDDVKACVDTTLTKFGESSASGLKSIRALKNKNDLDLKSKGSSSAAAALKGSYSRKQKLGTTSGEKFEATDDIKLSVEDDDLQFDVLLNFFDEQECSLNGSARPLKSGRFLYQGSGKHAKCRLLIFKEGGDLVLADDPQNSCKSACGKNGSFFNARFPASSRK